MQVHNRPRLAGNAMYRLAMLVAMCAGLVGAAWAQVTTAPTTAREGARESPTLYFKQNRACLTWPNCQIPASPAFPNPNDYTTLATLTLPPGDYLITSKLSAFAAGGTSYVNFECALLDVANPSPLDYSSFDGTAEQTLFLQTPVSLRARHGGTVRIGCRAFGFQPDGVTLVDMHVWNVNIAALAVGSIKSGFQ